ncbi:hypothetical protein [Streptomyces sp. NPDC057293]|uniref:hypothetical protein n=1 Tax=unclassified Streptomyces TaxID=2593676 RepID=UPI003636C1F6
MIRVSVTVAAYFDDTAEHDTRAELLHRVTAAISSSLKADTGHVRLRIEGSADHIEDGR